MKKIFLFAAAMLAGLAVQAEPVVSGELFATYQKQGDTFYRGNTTIDEAEPDGRALDINYYIVSLGQTMLFRAINPGEDINFGGAGWEVQLRVYNSEGGAQSEVQACNVVDQHHHFTGADCQTKINATTDDLLIHFFLSSNIEGGYRRTETINYNRASINNPIDDAIAPVINPDEVTMVEDNGNLVFTFGDVTAEEPYFFYVADANHNVGAISLTGEVSIVKPTVEDGTTYTFKCYAVDYNGNKSESKEFTLEMPFDPAVDLALNKACKAGAVQNDNTADRAVNGNPDNFWTCFGQGEETDWWWSVDLGNAYMINHISIHFNDAWEAYSLLYSWDNETWKTVLENETAESNSTKDYNTLDFSARYLKVTSVGSHLGIREFNVFATGLAEQDQQTPTSVVATDEHLNVQKLIRNAQLLILRDGEIYTVQGTLVR